LQSNHLRSDRAVVPLLMVSFARACGSPLETRGVVCANVIGGRNSEMLYDVYEVQSAFVAPFRAMAGATASRLRDSQADGNDIRAPATSAPVRSPRT
jgi:hypothetical protein